MFTVLCRFLEKNLCISGPVQLNPCYSRDNCTSRSLSASSVLSSHPLSLGTASELPFSHPLGTLAKPHPQIFLPTLVFCYFWPYTSSLGLGALGHCPPIADSHKSFSIIYFPNQFINSFELWSVMYCSCVFLKSLIQC